MLDIAGYSPGGFKDIVYGRGEPPGEHMQHFPVLARAVGLYSGSQSHTTRRGRASCSLWYAPVANVCDLLLFLNENRVIPEFRHF